jgi:ABC-type thiamine transport system ATPase subunit
VAIVMPGHVALTGGPGAGGHVLAALIGGQLDPSVGRLTFGGVELSSAEPAERARRIGYEGGDTILMAGTLRQNLLYGCPDPEAPDIDRRLTEAVAATGISRFVHARGLAGTIDPKREPKLAAAIVDARRAVQSAIAETGLTPYVDPFDPEQYNRHATIAENILFGVPLGDTFREHNLPSHPFVRAILEAEDLTKPLTAMGLAVAANMIEIFADIPDGHPLFDRFSFFTAAERAYFQDLLERQGERRRDAESTRDRERLIGLALRYNESRHRLGLLDAALESRLVTARKSFAKLLPVSLQPAIEFYDPDRLCAAASLQDNLLFGRVAHDRAGAENEVRSLIRRVLTDRGLDQEVFRVGLETRVDTRGDGLSASEIAAVDLARCLVRRPDVVVVERAIEALPGALAGELIQRLRRALIGRGLIVVATELTPEMDAPPFDMVVRFEQGGVADVQDRRSRPKALDPTGTG